MLNIRCVKQENAMPKYWDCWSKLCLFVTCLVASMFHLLLICLDRCWILYRWKTRTKRYNKLRFCCIVVLTWTLSILVIVTPFVAFRHPRNLDFCSITTVFRMRDVKTALKIWSMLFASGITIVMGSCVWMSVYIYFHQKPKLNLNSTETTSPDSKPSSSKIPKIKIIKVHPASSNTTDSATTSNGYSNCLANKISKTHKKAVVTISILASCLLVCLTPMLLMCSLDGWLGAENYVFSTEGRHFVVFIASINSAINPLIYAFRVVEVREILKEWKERIQCCHCYFTFERH